MNNKVSIFERARRGDIAQKRLISATKAIRGFRTQIQNGLPPEHAVRKQVEAMLDFLDKNLNGEVEMR
jgi:hypothetical protein